MPHRTRRILDKLRDTAHTFADSRELDLRLCAILAEAPEELVETVEQYCAESGSAVWRRFALWGEEAPMDWRLWWRLRATCEVLPHRICEACLGHGDSPGLFGPMTCTHCKGTGAASQAMLVWRSPVTWRQWRDANMRTFGKVTPAHPVRGVTWFDAVRFCNRATAHINSLRCTDAPLRMAYRTHGHDEAAQRQNLRLDDGATGFRLPDPDQWAAFAGDPPALKVCLLCRGYGWLDALDQRPLDERCPACMGSTWTTDALNALAREDAGPQAALSIERHGPNRHGLEVCYGLTWEWGWRFEEGDSVMRPCMGGFVAPGSEPDATPDFVKDIAVEQIDEPTGLRPILPLTPLDRA